MFYIYADVVVAQAWIDKNYAKKFVLRCTTEVETTDSKSDDPQTADKQSTDKLQINSDDPQAADKQSTDNLQIRTDVQWSLETATEADGDGPDPKERKCVAVMEYKRKHLINPKELTAARFYQDDQVKLFVDAAKTEESNRTYFQKTALWYIKQVKAYQTKLKVKDVCLFDWDTMFILYFDDFDPDKESNTKESQQQESDHWPAGILHQEQGNSSKGAAAELTFRSLLLAFLIRALKRMPELSKNPPPPPTYDQSRMLNPLIFSPCWYLLWRN